MIIMRCSEVGFKKKGTHTCEYADRMMNWIGGGKDATRTGNTEGTFKWVVADSYKEALVIMQKQVLDYVSNIGWLKADPEDLWFYVQHEEVKDGMFWKPCSSYCLYYRLSDLRDINP